MRIHWLVWVVVGGGIAFWSYTLGDKFSLFFYAGMVFVGIGGAKLVFGRAKPTKEGATLHHPQHAKAGKPHATQHSVPHPATHKVAAPPTLRQSHHACPRCRYVLNPSTQYCSMCGLRVR